MKKEMMCPSCEFTTLLVANRQGIEIDYCPACRGVWLDKGELDKIIEKTYAEVHKPVEPPRHPAPPEYRDRQPAYAERPTEYRRDRDDDDDDHYRRDPRHGGKRRRKEGFLDNIFDIFD